MVRNSFVAIDFETAQPAWRSDIFICQIGIVVVEDGIIKEKISRLVQPPENKIEKGCTDVHGITPKMTKNEPAFDIVWTDIEKYFINRLLIAHNATAFDERVLWQNLEYYNLYPKGINKFIDTMTLFKSPSQALDALCMGFEISCDNHHDATADAECCAQIYLFFLEGKHPDYDAIDHYAHEKLVQKRMAQIELNDFSDLYTLNDDDFEALISHTVFEGKRVINTGELSCIERDKLKMLVTELGGRYTSSVSKNLDYVILGKNPGPSKLREIINLQKKGVEINCITENQLVKLLKLFQ